MAKTDDQNNEVTRYVSDATPTHYMVMIEMFSVFRKNSLERYETGEFEAGGYKWKLVLHPYGNKSRNVDDHVSLYLAMAGTSSLSRNWEVFALFRLFLLDQNKDNYLILQDGGAGGKEIRRFHGLKHEFGFDKFIRLQEFSDAGNGYLVDDCCVFGAEVFVCKERSRGEGECLRMVKEPIMGKHTWKIENFSKLPIPDIEYHGSRSFVAGGQKWKILAYPKGSEGYLSLYLALDDPTKHVKVYAEFTLRIQDHLNGRHQYAKRSNWFSESSPKAGWNAFISLSYFTICSVGLLVNDTCIIEAEVNVIGVTKPLLL